MDKKAEIMLYVEDVAENAKFWRAIGFSVEEVIDFTGASSVSIRPTEDSSAIFNLYDINQVRMYSPEVAENKPAILFHAPNLDELNEKILAAGGKTSDVMTFENGVRVTNFADNEGTFFAVIEE
ncbi:hypothetical protein OZX68_02505 [Streptococcaceae bacterium ESL0729]|nr:hypothetical protein OZX68_02505 [Streptococcaceae bacterium ESL0729]